MRRTTLVIFAAFLAVQVLGLFVGAQFLALGVSVVEDPSDLANSAFFFAYILLSALVLLVVLHYYKGRKLFYGLELLLVFASVQLLAALFVDELASLAIGAAAVGVRVLVSRAKTALLLLASAVIGALLGASLDLLPAAVLALLLAGYDLYAVFVSKHMVALATELEKRQAAFSVTAREAKEVTQLGTGDLVIPLVLSVSAGKISALAAVGGLVGACAGFLVLFYVLEKRRGFWPALPPLVFYSLVGIAAALAPLPF